MKIGVSTTDFKQAPADALFGKISGFGFGVIQLSLANISESNFSGDGAFEIPETIDRALMENIAAAALRRRLTIAAVNGTYNMAHPDRRVRAEGARRFGILAEAVGFTGCRLVTLCSGTRNTNRLWAAHPENGSEGAWADMMESMKRLADTAERFGLTLAVETEASNIIDTPAKARRALDETGSGRFGMIMDCANLFRPGEAKKPNVDARIAEAFKLFGDRVVLAHGKDVAESDGLDFCAAGEGIVNFNLFLELLGKYGYSGDMILHGIKNEAKMPAALAFMKKCAGV